jgi:hypothetical protein
MFRIPRGKGMTNIDHDSYDPNYKRERNKDRNKIVNTILLDNKPKPDINPDETRIEPRHGYTGQKVGKFWIKSLSKKRRPSTLDEEDKQILRDAFGSDGSGVSKVDERTYYPDSSGVFY